MSAPAQAGKLTDVFRSELLAELQLEPLGEALADTVATTYPVASASSSAAYVFDPASEAFVRETRILGPILGERAGSIGAGEVDFSLTYTYVSLDSINGQSLHRLRNKPSIDGRLVNRPLEQVVEFADGRVANFLPVQVDANIDVDAHIITPGFTYGFTPNFDLNVTLPLVYTSLDTKIIERRPDPRLPDFRLAAEHQQLSGTFTHKTSDSSFGVGDVLFRARYVFYREKPANLALQCGLSLPSGDEDNLQGTGTTRVQPLFIASRIFFDRIEPLLNLGFDINANDVDKTAFRWAVGASGQVYGPITAAAVFLGRNEFSRQTDSIDAPFFFQIERNDIYDVALGLRWLFWREAVLSANLLVPLNDDGLRAVVVPTVQLEYVFSTGDGL